jgi:hypothetical protein
MQNFQPATRWCGSGPSVDGGGTVDGDGEWHDGRRWRRSPSLGLRRRRRRALWTIARVLVEVGKRRGTAGQDGVGAHAVAWWGEDTGNGGGARAI